jgi:hypothetical protein
MHLSYYSSREAIVGLMIGRIGIGNRQQVVKRLSLCSCRLPYSVVGSPTRYQFHLQKLQSTHTATATANANAKTTLITSAISSNTSSNSIRGRLLSRSRNVPNWTLTRVSPSCSVLFSSSSTSRKFNYCSTGEAASRATCSFVSSANTDKGRSI